MNPVQAVDLTTPIPKRRRLRRPAARRKLPAVPTPTAARRAAALALLAAGPAAGQGAPTPAPRAPAQRDTAARPAPWYERLSLRGYTQVRSNGLLRTNPALACPQCDRTYGPNGGLSLRRVRLILSGDVGDRVSLYVQPDFASEVDGTLGVGQLRDAYADVFLDRARAVRVRLGQSKIPYGWENMQSSGNRVPFDRSDGINSALPNERDVAALLYWAPPAVRRRLRALVDSGLKGSGDYGVVGLGAFNGQGTNRPDANNTLHAVARVAYPFLLRGGRVVELGVQGYRGRYVLPAALRSPGVAAPDDFLDARVAGTAVLYPQPFGVQAEWNVGRGPEADPAGRAVRTRPLRGGYVMAMYRARPAGQELIPYARVQSYRGGKKFELDARRYRVREAEVGVEWEPYPAFELTAAYAAADRRQEDATTPVNRQRGRLLRLQAQVNY